MKLNHSKIRNLTSTILSGALRAARLACRIPFLRANPKLRAMDYACPIIEELPAPAGRRHATGRKRRRLSVRSTNHPQR
jgi:hypothetical protein